MTIKGKIRLPKMKLLDASLLIILIKVQTAFPLIIST